MRKPIAILMMLTLAMFVGSVGFGYLLFDDPDYTFLCPFVKDGLTLPNLTAAFSNLRHGGIYMPFTWLSYQLTVMLFGHSPAAQHVVNVLLHVVNAALVMKLFERLGLGKSALFAALVWALHPQRAEAVCWIAARKELVWSFFALLALLATLTDDAAARLRNDLAAFLFTLCACLSKPTAMVLPLAVWLLRRKDVVTKGRGDVVIGLGYLILSLATALTAVYSQTHPEGMMVKGLFYAPLRERLVNAVNAVGLYLAQTFVPWGVHLDCRWVHGLPLGWYIGLPFALGAALWWFWTVRKVGVTRWRSDGAVLNCVVFLLLLAPTLGIFGSFGEHARADRFLYLPSVFLLAALFHSVTLSLRHTVTLTLIAAIVAFSIPVVFSYRSDYAVFSRTLEFDAENPRALAHIGEARCAAGALDEGIDMLRRSRLVRPSSGADARLAYALMRRGASADHSEIIALFASNEVPDNAKALEALGTAELATLRYTAAEKHLSASVVSRSRTHSPEDALLKLGYVWQNTGRHRKAVEMFEKLLRSTRRDVADAARAALDAISEDESLILF